MKPRRLSLAPNLTKEQLIVDIRSDGDNGAPNHKVTISICKAFALFIGFVVVVTSIFLPWDDVRMKARSSISDYLTAELLARANATASQVSELLSEFQTMSEFLSNANSHMNILECKPENIIHLLRYATAFGEQAELYLENIMIADANNLCHISGTMDNLVFRYGYRDGEFLNVKKYDENVDFVNFKDNYKDIGTVASRLPLSAYEKILASFPSDQTYWSHRLPLFRLAGETEPVIESNTIIGNRLVTASICLESLYKMVIEPDVWIAFVTSSDEVIFEGDVGIISPNVTNERDLVFPHLSELSPDMGVSRDLWLPAVETLKDVEDNKIRTFNIDEDQYYVIKSAVTPKNGMITHRFYMITSVTDRQAIAYRLADFPTVILIGALMVYTVLFLALHRRITTWAQKRLDNVIITMKEKGRKHKAQYMEYLTGVGADDQGVLGKVIEMMRYLELKYPTDIILNSVLDTTVLSLTEQQNKHFIMDSRDEDKCPFCKYLVARSADDLKPLNPSCLGKKPVNTKGERKTLAMWRDTKLKELCRESVEFDGSEYINYSSFPKLIRLFVKLMEEHDLIFNEVPPDGIIQFLVNVCECNTTINPIHTAHVLCIISKLIQNQFQYRLNVKIEVLALFITAFVMDVDIRLADFQKCKHVNESDEYSYMSDDTSFDEALGSKKNQCEALCDDASVVEERVEIITDLLSHFLMIDKDNEIGTYFRDLVAILYRAIDDKREFDLLGRIRVRVQSPRFSVREDLTDRVLFMQYLLKLASYCQYYTYSEEQRDAMLREIAFCDSLMFTREELEDRAFIASFHFEFASKIVAPWIHVVQEFNPLDEFARNLASAIRHWELER